MLDAALECCDESPQLQRAGDWPGLAGNRLSPGDCPRGDPTLQSELGYVGPHEKRIARSDAQTWVGSAEQGWDEKKT